MIAQYVIAAILLAAVAGFVVRLNIGARAEGRRRAALSEEERKRLAAEDAQWQQQYGP